MNHVVRSLRGHLVVLAVAFFAVTGASVAANDGLLAKKGAAAPTTIAWAHVQVNGTIVAASGVTSVSHPSTGRYAVKFGKDLTKCAVLASRNGGWESNFGITSFFVGKTATVLTTHLDVLADRPFSVAALC